MPLKKIHMLRCAQSPRSNVLVKYASARRFFARLASEFFLSSLQTEFFIELFRSAKRWSLSDFVTPSGALLTAYS
jgi:hypothetical protein